MDSSCYSAPRTHHLQIHRGLSIMEAIAIAESHKAVLTTLQLLEIGAEAGHKTLSNDHVSTACLLCDEQFQLDDLNPILKHLVEEHRLVIAGVKTIADFRKYAEYWKKRLQEKPIDYFCSVIETNTGPNDTAPKEKFRLLCDILPEDKQLRQSLQREKLEEILEQQAREREMADFDRGCLFCKERFTNRCALLNHMAADHSFSVGKPDNIVYVREFMDTLREKLDSLQCLYCENTFKDRLVLKEHMRKKNHKRIKSSNKAYDKFYVVNYLELGKNWEETQGEELVEESAEESGPEDEWSEWSESADLRLVCLFCPQTAASRDDVMRHMTRRHGFDLEAVKARHQLTFYQQVKLINYIRRQIYQKFCIYCDLRCDTSEELVHHMTTTGHVTQIPDVKTWNQPQYFFPTYEDDALLYALDDTPDDTDDVTDDVTDCAVFPEDTPVVDRIVSEIRSQNALRNSEIVDVNSERTEIGDENSARTQNVDINSEPNPEGEGHLENRTENLDTDLDLT